jgi:hypothetical protein
MRKSKTSNQENVLSTNDVEEQNTKSKYMREAYIARSNEFLGWGGVGNRQLLCFFKA